MTGSQISALDLGTGRLETVSAKGGDIIAPDDVAFDPDGNLYATEVMDGRVSVRDTDGRTRVLRDDLPCANGITVHHGRLFISECREGGRLMELDRASGSQRILLENLPSPNAMEVGPDGLLYFPVMTANEIWRIDPDGGEPQRVAGDLGVPDAVKFDARRLHRVDAGGQRPGAAHRSAQRRADPAGPAEPGSGQPDVRRRPVVRLELHRRDHRDPRRRRNQHRAARRAELAAGSAVGDDGRLYVADGTYFYAVAPDGVAADGGHAVLAGLSGLPARPGASRCTASSSSPPPAARSLATDPLRAKPTTSQTDFDQLYGVAIGPGGAIVFAELGTGRVHCAAIRQRRGARVGPARPRRRRVRPGRQRRWSPSQAPAASCG